MTRRAIWIGLVLLACVAFAHAQTVVAYSRADVAWAMRAYVFAGLYGPALIDRDMAPGLPWRQTMAGAICAADRVLLLWSAQAAVSVELRREIDIALACRVALVPVLLDSTPLPGVLADINALDWR